MKIFEAARLLRENKISPVELAKTVLDAIKEKDIGAYITVYDDVIKQAEFAQKNKTESLLWGIPVGVKDNICTKGVVTTAGSRMLEDFVPPYDATVVEMLKSAGAVITGKTNMDEFGMGSDCMHSALQVTSNPVDYDYVPGGSSGGSAAAVKGGLALGALGSDTGGSVRQPAAFCGIFGLKPTYSLVSRYGLIAFASSLDCVGTMCQSAKDSAIMLDAIAGYDKKDATSRASGERDYYKNLNSNIKGAKIGVVKELFECADEEIKCEMYKAIKNFETLGVSVNYCSLKSADYIAPTYYVISSAEAASNLARYDAVKFGKRADNYQTLEEMYINTRSEYFGREVKKRIILGTLVLSEGYCHKYYSKAKVAREVLREEVRVLLDEYDVLLTPVSNIGVWKKNGKCHSGDIYRNGNPTEIANLGGYPAMSIPCGRDKNNMPVGLQLMGRAFAEQKLLDFAWAYEEGGFCDGV